MSNQQENLQGTEYQNIYGNENKTIPYSPRGQFGFMGPEEGDERPRVYEDENMIIPYSPRGKFGFVGPEEDDEHPRVYEDENMTIPYSPRGQFGFMHPPEVAYPRTYENENKTIPYSPRGQFGFMNPTDNANGTMIKLESMKDMSIDQIVELYKSGYRIESTSPSHKIETTDGITISSGSILLIGIGVFAYMFLKR